MRLPPGSREIDLGLVRLMRSDRPPAATDTTATGATIYVLDGAARVTGVLNDCPASQAGLTVDDHVVAIDADDVAGLGLGRSTA